MLKKEKLSLDELLEQALVKDEDKLYEVPSNWVWTQIGNLFEVTSSKRVFKEDWKNEGIPFYRTREISVLCEKANVDNELFITEKMYEEYKEKYGIPSENDLLVSGVGTIGKVYVVKKEDKFYFKDGNIIWFKNISNTNAKFVSYIYRSFFMINQIHDFSSGTTVDTYTIVNAKRTYIPLPPLPEQQRIVDLIESLFEKLDHAKELAQNALDSFENRKSTILHKTFTGELTARWREENKDVELANQYLKKIRENRIKIDKTNYFEFYDDDSLPLGWCKTKIENFIYIAGRIGWKGLKAEEYTEIGPIFLSVYNLNYGDYVNYDEVNHISEQRYEESSEIMLKENDILLTKDGAGIGKLGFIRELPSKATINSSLLLIRANDSVEPKYLFYFLKGPQLQEIVKSRITGSTTPHLFQRDIKQFELPIPPISEQKEIVRIRKRKIQPVYNYCSFCCKLLSLSLQDSGKSVDHGISESSTL